MIDDEPRPGAPPRALSPDHPVLRGTAQNPDVVLPGARDRQPVLRRRPGHRAGRDGRASPRSPGAATACSSTSAHPEAERVIVLMGSGRRTAAETVDALRRAAASGSACCRYGSTARSRPSRSSPRCPPRRAQSPCSTAPRSPAPSASRSTSTWSPRSPTGSAAGRAGACRWSSAGATGLSSKEFTPAMVAGGLRRAGAPRRPGRASPSASSTTSPAPPLDRTTPTSTSSRPRRVRAVVLRPRLRRHGRRQQEHRSRSSATETALHAQGYFVYDSKKSGAPTVSHLRFGPRPDPRAVPDHGRPSFVGCHQFDFLERFDVLGVAAPGATFLLNSPLPRRTRSGTSCRARSAADHRPRRLRST